MTMLRGGEFCDVSTEELLDTGMLTEIAEERLFAQESFDDVVDELVGGYEHALSALDSALGLL